MTAEPSQENIWSHFQNRAPARIFQASHARHRAILRTIRRLAGKSAPKILNVGIGDGHLERTAQTFGWSTCSLDPDAETVNRLRGEGLHAETGVIEAMPFADGQFDFVVASEVFEHLSDEQWQAALGEIRRTLKPGGWLVGTVPYREDLELNVAACPNCRHVFHRWGHTTAFDLPKIQAELATRFGDVHCRVTAFVDFQERSVAGRLKGLVRLLLAKTGSAVAMPSILFTARKGS